MSRFCLFFRTFVVGGVVGLLATFLMHIFVLYDFDQLTISIGTLFLLGLFGSILFASDLFERLFPKNSATSFLPFSGLGPAVGEVYYNARRSGASIFVATISAWKFFFVATGAGIAIAIITGIVWELLGR